MPLQFEYIPEVEEFEELLKINIWEAFMSQVALNKEK